MKTRIRCCARVAWATLCGAVAISLWTGATFAGDRDRMKHHHAHQQHHHYQRANFYGERDV